MAARKTINERLEEVRAAAAPSMVPQPIDITPPPPKEEEVIPQLSDLVQDRKKRLEIARLVAQQGELGRQISALSKERDKLTPTIKKLMGDNHIGKCLAGEW